MDEHRQGVATNGARAESTSEQGWGKDLANAIRLLGRLSRLSIDYRQAQDNAINAKFVREPSLDAPDKAWMEYRNSKRTREPLERESRRRYTLWDDCMRGRSDDLARAGEAVEAISAAVETLPKLISAANFALRKLEDERRIEVTSNTLGATEDETMLSAEGKALVLEWDKIIEPLKASLKDLDLHLTNASEHFPTPGGAA